MECIVGGTLALGVGLFATLAGFDRDRAFYPAVLVVIASYYDLFAVMSGGGGVLGLEIIVFAGFACMSVIGFQTNLWVVVGALIGHGLFDLVHGELIENAGVPNWWSTFCLTYDVVAGGYLAWLLVSKRVGAQGRTISTRPRPARGELKTPVAGARTVTGALLSLMLAAVGLLGASPSSAAPPEAGSPEGDSYHIAYRALGSGKPVVVMISGLGFGMATFENVAQELAKSATVIIYDRSGYGGSGIAQGPRDAAGAEQELSRLLEETGIPGPYVLAGWSLGGLFAEYYAAKHPDQIAGLILEESRPADFGRRCENAGLSACTPLPSMVKNAVQGVQDEVLALPATQAQVEVAGAVKDRAVLVLSRPVGGRPFDAVWAAAQRDLAARYPGSRHLVAIGGGHDIHNDQEAWYVEAVQDFLRQLS